jgi:hypothetical protein
MQYHYKEGHIYNAHGKKMGAKCNSGYIKVTISSGNKKRWYAHRWIWTHFNGKIPDGYEIHHMDSNKKNNNINNLKLVTKQQNVDMKTNRGNVRQKSTGNWQALRKKNYLGTFGTKCGAIMACNLAYI